MIATRPLIASTTLLLAAVGAAAVPLSAGAAADTCQGKVATIVQSTGTVNGTDGDDVIVAGSGDSVCPVTTVLRGRRERHRVRRWWRSRCVRRRQRGGLHRAASATTTEKGCRR